MTTIDDAIRPETAPETEHLTAPRRRRWPRVVAGFLIGFAAVVAAVSLALYAWDSGYEGRVLPGVSVGGIDLSGMDRATARAALDTGLDRYTAGRVVVRTVGGQVEVPYAAFSRHPDLDAMVDEALAAGRSGTLLERAIGELRLARDGVDLTPRVAFDAAALGGAIRRGVAAFDRMPLDGSITMTAAGPLRTLARPGRSFDAEAALAAVVPVVARIDAPDVVSVDAPVVVVPPVHGDDETIAAEAAAARVIKRVTITLDGRQWKLSPAIVGSWVSFGVDANGAPWPVVDRAAIATSLKRIKKDVHQGSVSAIYLKTRSGKVVGVVAAKEGRALDVKATAASIASALDLRAQGMPATPVEAKVQVIEPRLSTAKALEKGPLMTRLGSWKTWFPISERNSFGANIWLPAKFIDGTVLRPGERFEWWSRIGPVTPARGFGMGGFIAGDHTDPTGALGGGMCSSSTTLFNAALRAGLQMGARSNHKYYIYRYPLGLDATVSKTRSGGGQTMSFTNDMSHPVVIRTFRYTAGGRGWVRYEIWGIPDGRKVSISKPSVWNVRKAVTSERTTTRLRHGVREQVEYPANGMDVSVTRVVRSAGGRVLHRDTYRTHYMLWNGVIEVGA